MSTNTIHILFLTALVLILLSTGYVNAGDNFVGGSSFGATCNDTIDGKTCSCTPPKTSSDCAKLLDNCQNTTVKVPTWTDDLGHEHHYQRVPDVTCTATKCECAWTENKSGGLTQPAMIQNQLIAPTKEAPSKPPLSKRFQKIPTVRKPSPGQLIPIPYPNTSSKNKAQRIPSTIQHKNRGNPMRCCDGPGDLIGCQKCIPGMEAKPLAAPKTGNPKLPVVKRRLVSPLKIMRTKGSTVGIEEEEEMMQE